MLFLLAPALNLLRFDLSEAQLWFLGVRWTLGIDALRAGEIDATQAGLNPSAAGPAATGGAGAF